MTPRKKLRGGDAVADGQPVLGVPVTGVPNTPTTSTANTREIFMIVYKILMVFAVLGMIIISIVAFVDVLTYQAREAAQAAQLDLDPRTLIDQTNDYEIIQYTVSTVENEPYNIYFEQTVVSMILRIVGIVLVLVGLQICAHIILYGLDKFGKLVYKEPLGFDGPFLTIVATFGAVGGGALALNIYYQKMFVKKIIPEIKSIRQHMREIRSHLIVNTSMNSDVFWTALKDDNTAVIVNALVDKLKLIHNGVNMGTDPNAKAVKQMLFAYNVYEHFKNIVPTSDSRRNTFDKIFSTEGKRSEFDINKFFMYGNIPLLEDLAFSAFKKDLEHTYNTAIQGNATTHVPFQKLVDDVIKSDPYIPTFNEKISILRNISKNKKKVAKFMYIFSFIPIIFLLFVAGIHHNFVMTYGRKFVELSKMLFKNVIGRVMSNALFFH